MRTSRNGTLFIAKREACVLVPYPDGPGALHSIGFGHSDPNLKPGDTISVPLAFELLRQDLIMREAHLNGMLKKPVKQHQFDALMSLHYQSGNRYIRLPIQEINAGDIEAAAELFPHFDRNLAGEQIPGLHKRRLLEQTLFQTGDYGELSPILLWRGDPKTMKPESYEVQEGDL